MITSPFRLAFGGLAALTLVMSQAAAHASTVGNAASGKTKIAMCIGCHGIEGYQASFPAIYKVPKIAGQNAKYIAQALLAYQKGDRKHPTMAAIAASLSEQDMADIAAYYENLGQSAKTQPPQAAVTASPEVAALLNKGNCVSCHGAGLNKPIDGSYPKLAGQHADYLLASLKSYSTPNKAKIGRSNAIMAGQVKMFSTPEMKLLADHIASLPGDVKSVEQAKIKAN